jgi:hypothetical protein
MKRKTIKELASSKSTGLGLGISKIDQNKSEVSFTDSKQTETQKSSFTKELGINICDKEMGNHPYNLLENSQI